MLMQTMPLERDPDAYIPNHLEASGPLRPSPLSPEMADFLRDKPFACLIQGTDHGTVLVIKAPGEEIQSVCGRVPIHLRYELYQHPAAPVIRMVVRVYDQPERPLALETFVNVEDPQQRADFAALAAQERLLLLFYDEGLSHRLTKVVGHIQNQVVTQILGQADSLLAGIPKERFDFDRAKQRVMERTQL